MFPKIVVPQNGWWKSWKTLFKQMDDLGGFNPLFSVQHPFRPLNRWKKRPTIPNDREYHFRSLRVFQMLVHCSTDRHHRDLDPYIPTERYTPVIKHSLVFVATCRHFAMLVIPNGFGGHQGFIAMLVIGFPGFPDGNPTNCLARFWWFFSNLIVATCWRSVSSTTSSVLTWSLGSYVRWCLVMLEKNMLDTSLLECCYVSRFLVVFKHVLSYQQLLGKAMLVMFWIGFKNHLRPTTPTTKEWRIKHKK